MSGDWIERAESSRAAWEDLSRSELDALMEPDRSFLDATAKACTRCGETSASFCEDWDCHKGWA